MNAIRNTWAAMWCAATTAPGATSIAGPPGCPSFADPVTYRVQLERLNDVAVGDLNADGHADLVGVGSKEAPGSEQGVSIFFNRGDGTFFDAVAIDVGTDAYAVWIDDIDGDQDPDIIVTRTHPLAPLALLNDGDGTFGTLLSLDVDADWILGLAELNAMSGPDLVYVTGGICDFLCSWGGAIAFNDGHGSFEEAATFGAISFHVPFSSEFGDLNADGTIDILIPTGDLIVILNNGEGEFADPEYVDYALIASVGDLDGDDDLDIVAVNVLTISVLLNDGQGKLTHSIDYDAVDDIGAACLGDLDGDGDLDIVTSVGIDNRVTVRLNGGDATFKIAGVVGTVGNGSVKIVIEDLNTDSFPDIVVARDKPGELIVLMNACSATCPADVNADGALNVLDFIAFQQEWQAKTDLGDCDHNDAFDILDFVCFQGVFQAGCT